MVDNNTYLLRPPVDAKDVQIPLWSIITMEIYVHIQSIRGSNSSMVDNNYVGIGYKVYTDDSSNSSMVDNNINTDMRKIEEEKCSNSSMVDNNPVNIRFNLSVYRVQIPLWSIITQIIAYISMIIDQFKFLYGR